ncbi:MAG: hypothetical protein NZZ41_00210 [Candidatus Dojkabacteria bacterium]|nr:hypothetical protein [Candidatus Dojkabacteria bacterium]
MFRITPEILAKTILLASYGIIKPTYNSVLPDSVKRRMQYIMSRPEFQREYFNMINRLKNLPQSVINNIGRRFILILEDKNIKFKISNKLNESILMKNRNYKNCFVIPPFLKDMKKDINLLYEYYTKEKRLSHYLALKKITESYSFVDLKKYKLLEDVKEKNFIRNFKNFLLYFYESNPNIKFVKLRKLLSIFNQSNNVNLEESDIIELLKNNDFGFIENFDEEKGIIEFKRIDPKKIKKSKKDKVKLLSRKYIKNNLN